MADNHLKIHKGLTKAPQAGAPANPTDGDEYYDATLNVFRFYENGAWKDLGSGGSGFKNLIDTPDSGFETGLGGWGLYNDGAADPVDLTGGVSSGNLAISITEVVGEILAGTKTMKVAKAASNVQGEGVSVISLPVDLIDRGKKMKISVARKMSANYVSGDAKVYAYDVVNSVFLTISSDFNQDLNDGTGTQEYFVDTLVTTETIRFGVHIASVSALAYDMFIDQVKIEIQDIFIPNMIGAWQEYSPVYTGFGIVTNDILRYRIVGDSIEIMGRFRVGTATAVEARIDLPSGFTASAPTSLGVETMIGEYVSEFVTSSNGGLLRIEDSLSYITFGGPGLYSGASIDATLSSNGNTVTNNNADLLIKCKIPVNELQGNTITGLIRNSGLESLQASHTLGTSIPNNVTTKVNFNTIDISSGLFDTGLDRFTANRSMSITVSSSVGYTANATGFREIDIYLNGSVYKAHAYPGSSVISGLTGNLTASIDLKKGDYIEIFTYQNSGGALALTAFAGSNYLDIREEPFSTSAIVQTNKVALIWDEKASNTEGGTSVTGSNIRALNSVKDPDNLVTVAANAWKFNKVGTYLVDATAPSYKAARTVLQLRKNGSAILTGDASYTDIGDNTVTITPFSAIVTVTDVDDTYDLDHVVGSVGSATFGLGIASQTAAVEIYTKVKITKIGG